MVLVDGFSSDVPQLLDRLQRYGTRTPHVRVLVTARDAEGLCERLRLDPLPTRVADSADLVHLESIGERSDHERWYDEFCRYYASRQDPPVPSAHLPALPEWTDPPIGLIQAAALAAVQHRSRHTRRLDLVEVLARLWDAEVSSWQESRRDPHWALSSLGDAELERGVLALCLLAPSPSDVEQALRRIPELAEASVPVLRNLARWAAYVYPPARASPQAILELRPHIVADAAFLGLAAASHDGAQFARCVLETPIETQAFALCTRLVRATPLLPTAAELIPTIIAGHGDRFLQAVKEALLIAPTNRTLDTQLAQSAATCELEQAATAQVLQLIPDYALLRTRVAVGARAIALMRADPNPHLPDLARALNIRSTCLRELGRRDDALAAIDEAITIYRPLAEATPDAFLPDLARALNIRSTCLRELGRRDDALAAIDDAITIYRPLAEATPDTAARRNGSSTRD